jgi:hypothetical protein
MKRRALLGAAGLSLIFVIVLVSPALAAFRGSDMYSNLMPGSGAGLVDRYPISSYALDSHVDNGVIGTSNISASLAQFFSWLFFFIGVVAMRVMIAIFEWASSANFITGENGVLGPVGVVSKQYYNDLVVPFLSTVIVLFGVWLAYKAAKREVGEAWSAIMRVVCMSVVAIAIIFHPADTIGRAFTFVGDLSESVITLGQGTQSASDTIFETFVYKPWVVIEFGGLRTCTSDKLDADGYPLAATASNPAKQCHSALSVGKDGHGDYARRFLRFAPSSAQRDAEYQALRDGKPPDGSVDVNQCPRGACTDDTLHDARAIRHQFDDIKIDRTDSPAVDMMQSGGAAQRLAFVVVVLVGMAGGILLLGLISIAEIFAQVALLLLVMIAPFMLLVAAHPSMHGYYMKWLKWIRLSLVAGLVYSIMLAVTLSTSRALMAIGNEKNETGWWLFYFMLQAVLFLGVFFKRKAITDAVLPKKDAGRINETEHHTKSTVASAAVSVAALGSGVGEAAAALDSGVGEAAAALRQGWSSRNGSGESDKPHTPDSTSPPASAGREHSPAPAIAPASTSGAVAASSVSSSTSPSTPSSTPAANNDQANGTQPAQEQQTPAEQPQPASDKTQTEGENMPLTSFRSDLANAQAQRADRDFSPPDNPPAAPEQGQSPRSGLATLDTFERDLEQRRQEQDLARRE